MGVKRKFDETNFSIDLFVKKLHDPETSFLALSEFNEYIRDNESIENLQLNFNDITRLITEDKRKASENITLYRFLTTLLTKYDLHQTEILLKKFFSISNSLQTIYFMLSSQTTASHLKVTLKFLYSLTQQNEYYTRWLFSSIDFKRTFWKYLFKRRNRDDNEDVRYWTIKFLLSPLIYQNSDLNRNLIKEQAIFHEMFNGLQYDCQSTIEFILDDLQTNIVMFSGMTKTDKLHLFNDRNLRSLINCYRWSGSGDVNRVRVKLHEFLLILFNSTKYGLTFFDPTFGTSSTNRNSIVLKVLHRLSIDDDYQSNLIVHCLRTCPDLLQTYLQTLSHDYQTLNDIDEFLNEIYRQQKPVSTWLNIFQNEIDSTRLVDIFVRLTIPIDLFKLKFVYTKSILKLFSSILERIQQVFDLLHRYSFVCQKQLLIQGYQQAIQYLPKLDLLVDDDDLLGDYVHLLKIYSHFDSKILIRLLDRLQTTTDQQVLNDYFQCLIKLDEISMRFNKDIRSLFRLSKQIEDRDRAAEYLSTILTKVMNANDELHIWISTWCKFDVNQEIESFLCSIIEKILLNPYPILEKQMKNTPYSLMIYSAFDNQKNITSIIDQYLCAVLVQLYINQLNRSILFELHEYLWKIYFEDCRTNFEIVKLLKCFSIENQQHIRMNDQFRMKLDIYEIFSLNNENLIDDIIQCLNRISQKQEQSFEKIFDELIEYIQSFTSERIVDILCRIIHGLDRTYFKKQPLKNSNILFDCLKHQPTNSRLIRFLFYYLSSEYRFEYLHYAANAQQLDILLDEIPNNPQIAHEHFLDVLIDNFHYNLEQTIVCSLELIHRLNDNANHILRLKQNKIFKLTKTNYENNQMRILVSKLIIQTVRSSDRSKAIARLIEKSSSALLLHAFIYRDLIEENEIEGFVDYLREVLKEYANELIVFELLKKCSRLKNEIMILLEEETDLIHQTTNLALFLKLYPTELTKATNIYQSILTKINKDEITDSWLITFNQCTNILLQQQIEIDYDFKDLINYLLKLFTSNSLNLLKTLLNSRTYQPKQFAKFLKHPNFVSTLSSSTEYRSIVVDILSRFVSFYSTNPTSIEIDCSKHLPMLLAIYSRTLTLNDQHTLACMYQYEKSGYSMKSIFLLGEEIIHFLDENRMKKSIEFYPVTRRLRTIEPQLYEHGDDIYDPAYLIPVFYHTLGSERLVRCQDFVDKHCLAYCLMALSSRCGLLRAVVYNCLVRFEQHLFTQKFYYKEQLRILFDLLKPSIHKSNLKLAPIVALFLSKLVELFTHPESKIYRTITRFLLKQPYLDLSHVPLFTELFHSSSIDVKYERHWILNLLKFGLKDSIDYMLCTKVYVWKILMTFYDCSLCDQTTKMDILNVFHSLTRIQEVIMSLLFDYGFLLWLQMVIKTCSSECLIVLISIIENLGTRLSTCDHQVQLLEFYGVLMMFIRRLRNESSRTDIVDRLVLILIQYNRMNNFGDIKFLVDQSTVEGKLSLLSCFC